MLLEAHNATAGIDDVNDHDLEVALISTPTQDLVAKLVSKVKELAVKTETLTQEIYELEIILSFSDVKRKHKEAA
jgi:hypothetical protein|tara:strand:+ start:159 stop:383 length:225 start_codon:yes stop_codon:yes gene_type:complete